MVGADGEKHTGPGCILEEESVGLADKVHEIVREEADLRCPYRCGKVGGGGL